MSIAILAPSPTPFVMGGAENLWLGLQRYINEETTLQCELIKVPVVEGNLKEIIGSYRKFLALNLNSYDHLITGKYPAWMTRHKSHSVYMLHPLRGLYDSYHFCQLPLEFTYEGHGLTQLKDMVLNVERAKDSLGSINELLDFVEELLHDSEVGALISRFPGPFSRQLIRTLDRIAMKPENIRSYAAISKTVAGREGYFPVGAKVNVLYPPPRLEGFKCGSDDYLFTTSRLDGPKRIDLLIEAMKQVKSNIQLLIGGKGPDEMRLRELADGDSRIVFLGYLNDEELIECYSNALAVPFIPYDEDYGLITIEAMKSAKPVITTIDSGGVREFVEDNQTGLLVKPEAKEIAAAIDYLCENRNHAREMGLNAKHSVEGITWRKVVSGLLPDEIESTARKKIKNYSGLEDKNFKKKKIVVAVTFPIYPPRGGGQSRIYNLYRQWANYFEIEIISLGNLDEPMLDEYIAHGLREIRIPKTSEHQLDELNYSSKVGYVPVTDIVASRSVKFTPSFIESLKKAAKSADVLVASHPYFVDQLKEANPNAELWFEAHNVEYNLKKEILPDGPDAESLLDMVRECESRCWLQSQKVFACAEADLKELEILYGPTKAIRFEVPNGFAVEEAINVGFEQKTRAKNLLGLSKTPTALFIGSWHGPNIEALEHIIQFSKDLPSVCFLVLGSVGLSFLGKDVPKNVKLLGVLDDKEKAIIISASDLALNPMLSGSGSNLKMFEYMCCGIPIVSTDFGARGIKAVPGIHYYESGINDFVNNIMAFFLLASVSEKQVMSERSRCLIHERYSWENIAKEGLKVLCSKDLIDSLGNHGLIKL